MSIPRFELSPGYTISRIIRGGWQLAQGHSQSGITAATAIEGLRRCAEAGITTIDCADIYTGVEDLMGRFLRQYRGDSTIQIHTKYVPDLNSLATLAKNDIAATINRSLQRLGVERLDLVQFHWWDYEIPGYVEAAQTLNQLRHQGKIRHIGVTNFDVTHLAEIVDAGVPVVSNQVQYSVLDRRPATEMATWCARHDISLLCYGALAGGFLSEKYLGAVSPEEPLENRSLTKYLLIIEEFGGWDRFQRLLRILRDIADRHNTNLSVVAARAILDQSQVGAAIVGMRRVRHISELAQAFSFEFDDSDRASIGRCLAQSRGPAGSVYALERAKGGRHEKIMKTNLNRT
jgi:aryl-alcohol dehydrogenase-like predicted oxidoreductase